MIVDNTITKHSRDIEPQGELAGFQIPQEVRQRYEVRIVAGYGEADRRIGLFLPGDRQNPSIEISGNGDQIVARREDPETIAALVTIAKHNGWDGIDVDGSPAFRKAVWSAGTREGLVVRGYEPEFDELVQMDKLRRDDTMRRGREPVVGEPGAEAVLASPGSDGTEATISVRASDTDHDSKAAPGAAGTAIDLSTGDQRLLLTLSAFTQDRKSISASGSDDLSPMEREFRSERLALNRDALDGALDRALDSETLATAFSKAGYAPDDLRTMARAGKWDGEIADAIYLVRSGLHRNTLALDRSDHATEPARDPNDPREPTTGSSSAAAPKDADGTRLGTSPTPRQTESEELAELFLHGPSHQLVADPRLASALEAQAVMERHLDEVFAGDQAQASLAVSESRQMISDVLRRGLDVSVREPAPVRQIDTPQPTSDLER